MTVTIGHEKMCLWCHGVRVKLVVDVSHPQDRLLSESGETAVCDTVYYSQILWRKRERKTGRCESSAWSVSLPQTDARASSHSHSGSRIWIHRACLNHRRLTRFFAQEVHEDVIRCWGWQDYTDRRCPSYTLCSFHLRSRESDTFIIFSRCLIISSTHRKEGVCLWSGIEHAVHLQRSTRGSMLMYPTVLLWWNRGITWCSESQWVTCIRSAFG